MREKIGVIASDIELKNSIIELFYDDIKSGSLIIDLLDPDNMENQGKILENKGAKVVVARSGGYKHITGTIDVPTVHLKITTLDILKAINKAKVYNKTIVLIIWEEVYFEYEDWKELIGNDIVIEVFKEKEHIKETIDKYLDKKEDIVIVGSGIACSLARGYGMDNVFLNATKESIYDTISYAKELYKNIEIEKFNTEIMKRMLDGIHDAVVAINNEHKVILYNTRAQELLGKSKEDVMNKPLLEVLPSLKFMLDILNSKKKSHREMRYIDGLVLTSYTATLKVDNSAYGVLCSFQDVTKLQKLEQKIRYELNKKGLYAKYTFEDIITEDKEMQNTILKAKKVAQNDETVIIYGESGTGKEMIAQSIHNISSRKDSPFIAINCAAISESLLESELFGYVEGAFTGASKGGKTGLFELAHGGTIFLDEINSISFNLQAKLLRVLEEKEIMRIGSDYVIPLDVRIISAANEDLKRMVPEGSFRRDLFYRLSILEIKIPPLRDRGKDIILLFNHFIKEKNRFKHYNISEELTSKLENYSWLGNVRELRNVAQRYLVLGDLNLDEQEISKVSTNKPDDISLDLKQIERFVEDKVINMLIAQGMTKTQVAKVLGISRTALWKKLNKEDDNYT